MLLAIQLCQVSCKHFWICSLLPYIYTLVYTALATTSYSSLHAWHQQQTGKLSCFRVSTSCIECMSSYCSALIVFNVHVASYCCKHDSAITRNEWATMNHLTALYVLLLLHIHKKQTVLTPYWSHYPWKPSNSNCNSHHRTLWEYNNIINK